MTNPMPPDRSSSPGQVAAPARGAAITVRGLSHAFRAPEGTLHVLRDLSLDVAAGDYVTITGSSGAGKSTLLSVLGGLDAPQSGTVEVGGTNLHGLRGDGLASYRRATVGFVFQHFGLVETLSALENVELAAALAGKARGARRRSAGRLLEAVGLADRAAHRPARLSGGERQRVAIARALVNAPRLVLADEPTGNLDEEAAVGVIGLLERVHRDLGGTLVVVTHNRVLSARAPRRLRLRDGALYPAA
jgi:putative ABC transport system ATP-binding protein